MHLRCIKPKGTKKRILSKQPTETIEIEVVLPRDTIEAPTTTNTEIQPQSPTTTANMSALSNSMNQLNDLRSYSRHWLGEFIDLYQAEECLWQPKHPDYSNHSVRNKAYDKLVEKLKEVEPHPDRAMVVRKINSLRSAFRREFRKSNSKANYETRLWYYDKLLFIAEQNPKRLSSPMDVKPPKRSLPIGFDDEDSMDYTDDQQMDTSGGTNGAAAQTDPIQSVEGGVATDVGLVKEEGRTGGGGGGGGGSGAHTQDDLHHHHTQLQQQQQQATAAAVAVQQAQPQHTTAVKVLEITSLDSNSQREIQQAVNTFEHQQQQMHQQLQQQTGQTHIHQQVPTIQISREHLQPLFGSSTYSATTGTSHRNDDEYDAIGINVASKLRVMNPTQRIIAEKLISDVLFNGQLDNLSINSTLTQ